MFSALTYPLLAIMVGLPFITNPSGAEPNHVTTYGKDAHDTVEQTYRGLRKQCPLGPDYTYISRNDTCHINFLCIQGTEAFKIAGCGCGCRKLDTTPHPNATCPSGPNYGYFTHKSPCVINFLCVRGKEAFYVPGCGCGCKTVKATPPPKPVSGNSTTRGGGHGTCPSGAGVTYVTHKYPCVVNFACISTSPEAFSVPGCGCGCKPRS
jgi:hypothetical protein